MCTQTSPSSGTPAGFTRILSSLGILLLAGAVQTSAQAQVVARPANVAAQLVAWLHGEQRTDPEASRTLDESPRPSFWSQWQPRMGVVLERSANPGVDTHASRYVMAQPKEGGLKLQGLHLLSDYPLARGLHLTTGLVRGDASQPWWSAEPSTGNPLSLSVEHLDNLAHFGTNPGDEGNSPRAQPYIGAGYATQGGASKSAYGWRFNADLGLLSINSGNIDRVMRVLEGKQAIDTLGQDLRLRPMLKISVKYAF